MADDKSKKKVSYQPTDGLSYDPNEDLYWDADGLRKEIYRVFEVCHGCRMCFKYCDAFVELFRLIDDEYDGDVHGLTDGDIARVMGACFQCKLCEVECPYTPRDGHEFQLDFPRLVHRYQAQRVKREGIGLRDRLMGNPPTLGKMARASFGLANVMNRFPLHRWLMEKMVGIHRHKLLPDFAATTFESWAVAEGRIRTEPGCDAVLFPTCFVDNNDPDLGRDTVEVLEQNGFEVGCVTGLACCGMPAWEHGDLATVQRHAKQNLDVLMPFVERGAKVVVIAPTCSMMLRREYPELVAPEDRERAAALAAAVVDPSELLWSIRKEDRFNTTFASKPDGQVAYHAPCHLRAQGVGFRGRDVIRKAMGVKVGTVMECCGQDGTWSMTVDGYEPANRIGKKAFDGMQEVGSAVWVSDCPLAHAHFEQNTGTRPLHPMTVLARGYRGEPWGTNEPREETDDS